MTSKILNGNTELTGIKSVVYTETVNAGDNLKPGAVCSAKIEVEVFGAQSDAPAAGTALTYYQVDENNNETLIGTFYAEPSIPTKNTYKFTAYDAVAKLDKDYSERLKNIDFDDSNNPVTIYTLVSDACDIAGVTLGSSSWPLSTQTVNEFYAELTCRNILQYAAELAGKFVRCNASGNIIFDWYTVNSTNSIHPGATQTGYIPYKQDGLTYDNFNVLPCDAVAIQPSGTEGAAYIYPTTFGTVTATDDGQGNITLTNLVATDDGNGNLYLNVGATDSNGNVAISNSASASNTLILPGNLLLTNATQATYLAAAQNIYSVMSALPTYRHSTIQLFTFLNPFRAGEFVSVTDAQGVSFTTPVFEMTVSASGAQLHSAGKQQYEASADTSKALANLANNIVQIDKLKVGYAEIEEAVINTLIARGIKAEWIESNEISTFGLNISETPDIGIPNQNDPDSLLESSDYIDSGWIKSNSDTRNNGVKIVSIDREQMEKLRDYAITVSFEFTSANGTYGRWEEYETDDGSEVIVYVNPPGEPAAGTQIYNPPSYYEGGVPIYQAEALYVFPYLVPDPEDLVNFNLWICGVTGVRNVKVTTTAPLSIVKLDRSGLVINDFVVDRDGNLFIKGHEIAGTYYDTGDTFTQDSFSVFAGIITGGSQTIHINVPVDRLMDDITTVSVTSVTGGIRPASGGYINGVLDGSEWVGLSGITITAAKSSARNVTVTIASTSAFTVGGNTVTNNTPVSLGGKVELSFS